MKSIAKWLGVAVLAAVPMWAGATFHPGDSGADVQLIQERLAQAGYEIGADGVYGAATEDAVRDFQRSRGLDADGLVGPATYRALLGRDIPVSRGDFSTSLVRRLVSLAREYIGVPYVFGGSSPSGFDCSGFVQYVANAAGFPLPRAADDQYHMGKSVGRDHLRAGDLVFFSTYEDGVSHSGIYLGGGHFISATSSRGVVVDSLDEAYWRDCYVGARRLI